MDKPRVEEKIRVKIEAGHILVVMYYLREDGSIDPEDYMLLGDVTPKYRSWLNVVKDLEITVGHQSDMEDTLKVHNLTLNSTQSVLFRAALKAMDKMVRKAAGG